MITLHDHGVWYADGTLYHSTEESSIKPEGTPTRQTTVKKPSLTAFWMRTTNQTIRKIFRSALTA